MQEEEIVLFPDETNPASPRRLSNARSTFSSRLGVDRLERSGSPTFFINGKIPQVQNSSVVDLHSLRQSGGGSEPRIHTLMPSINNTLPSLQPHLNSAQVQYTHASDFRLIEQRLENLETRLTAMEGRLTENFETILSYLRSSSRGHSAPELRHTNV